MTGRFLAVCGWLADLVARPFRSTPPGRFHAVPAIVAGVVLLAVAALPIVLPLLQPQPEDVAVQAIFDDAVTHPEGWVRLRGKLTAIDVQLATDRSGPFALLADAADPLSAVAVVTGAASADPAVVTGHVVPATVVRPDELPIEATVAGTPPRIVPDAIVVADPVPHPVRQVPWPLAVPPAVLGLMLLVGARAGYPVFRPTREIDVLAAPLGPGERLPAAWGGRIGPHRRSLADPGAVLLLVRHGPNGSLLTAQPLPDDDGPAPQPVIIGGSWSVGRRGWVFAVRESVPALVLRAELVEATFLFARVAERDRVAALVGAED